MDASTTVIFTWLVIYCYSGSRICDAKLADASRTSCDEGQFHFSRLNKCMPCIFICQSNEPLCLRSDCLEYLKKQCKPEECYDKSNGKCIHSRDITKAECKETHEYITPGPPAPSHLKVIHSTAADVTVKWLLEFNGKSDLKIYVQYKKCAEEWDVASEVPQGGIADRGLKKTARYHDYGYVVTDLESNVCYEFRVRSCNSGSHTSVFSNVVSATTTRVATTTTNRGVSQDNSNEDSREDVDTSNHVARTRSHAGGYFAHVPAWVAYAICGMVVAAAVLVGA